jgi:hypothetical protein
MGTRVYYCRRLTLVPRGSGTLVGTGLKAEPRAGLRGAAFTSLLRVNSPWRVSALLRGGTLDVGGLLLRQLEQGVLLLTRAAGWPLAEPAPRYCCRGASPARCRRG